MIDQESNLFTLQAMLKQEEACYGVPDFFHNLPAKSEHGLPVDASARSQIAQWCINIMDACKYPREHAYIIMSCLDRFVSTSEGRSALLNRCEYQLAALTSVYTCVKVHCPQALSPDLVARLSQGSYTKQDIEAMELKFLSALQWRVNPPTIMDFLRIYLNLIPSDCINEHTRKVIVELVGYQADLSLSDFNLSRRPASFIAFASLLNAIESIFVKDIEFCEDIAQLIETATEIDPCALQILRGILYEAIIQTNVECQSREESSTHAPINKRMHRDSFSESPRSVFQHPQSIGQ